MSTPRADIVMVRSFTENTVKDVALALLESLGYTVKHGREIAPGEPATERSDYRQVVLEDRLRDTLLPKLISSEPRVSRGQRLSAETKV